MSFQHVVITGASSGMGAGLAVALAKEGSSVALYGRDAARLGQVADQVTSGGGQCEAAVVDVTNQLEMRASLEALDDRSPVDCVIANAGVSLSKDGWSGEAHQQVTTVNVQGVLNTILPLIDRMRVRRQGHVVLMSSLAAYTPTPQAPAYSASKAWVRQYGLALGPLLAKDGITVSVVCPGFVDTPLVAGNRFPMPGLITVDKAVEYIIKGLHDKRPLIGFPRRMFLPTVLMSCFPGAWVARWIYR